MRHRKTDIFFLICGLFMLSGEIWKQLTLTFILGGGQYNWWYFPFQLCSIPMYILLIYPRIRRHILLIILGISAGTVYLRLLSGHQKKAPLRPFLYATCLYLACCLAAVLLNIAFDRYGTINLFYINPDYRMQQIVFRDLVPRLGNNAVILLYMACTILGAFLLFLLWKGIFLLRRRF